MKEITGKDLLTKRKLVLLIGVETLRVSTMQEAVDRWVAYRDDNEDVTSDAPTVLVQEGSSYVASITYNGRVWALQQLASGHQPLLAKADYEANQEPFNFCLYEAPGDKIVYPVNLDAAEMYASFARECFTRYEDFSINDQWSDVYVCWSSDGNIIAILALFDSFAKYSPAMKEAE